MVSLSQLLEIPSKNLILLVGPPGSGKSTFSEKTILHHLTIDKPIIYVTTEHGPSKAEASLREKGLGRIETGLLSFVDAYNETVGVSVTERPDTIFADCNDLSSIDIAISKLTKQIGKKGILLVFDSLTSPYLFSGTKILRFMRETLSRFAARGNAVLGCMDEGCGKSEDLVAMMSLSNGVIKVEMEKDRQLLDVVKHPEVRPTRIEVPIAQKLNGLKFASDFKIFDPNIEKQCIDAMMRGDENWARKEVGDFVNLFWPNLVIWSGMLWDPKRFPKMKYELDKLEGTMASGTIKLLPWHMRLLFKFMPKDLNKVNNIKKLFKWGAPQVEAERSCIMEYLEDRSKPDEHYIRLYESYACWGFENLGAPMAFNYLAGCVAGSAKGFEGMKGLERDWNAVETKCVGLGDPYCEIKLVPGEIDELKYILEKTTHL